MIYDDNGNVISGSVDLSLGYIAHKITVKKTASPIDNLIKFAWSDDDYEVIDVYVPFSDDRKTVVGAPARADNYEDRISRLEEKLAELEHGENNANSGI